MTITKGSKKKGLGFGVTGEITKQGLGDEYTDQIEKRIQQNMNSDSKSDSDQVVEAEKQTAITVLQDKLDEQKAKGEELEKRLSEMVSQIHQFQAEKQHIEVENGDGEAQTQIQLLESERDQLSTQVAGLESELQSVNDKATELAATQNTLKEQLDKFQGLMTLRGDTSEKETQTLEVLGEGSAESRRYLDLLQTENQTFNYKHNSDTYHQQSVSESADRYWRSNSREISQGIEALMKAEGFFAGTPTVTQDITIPTDIPSMAFQHLSSMVRQSYYDDLILSQFARKNVQLGISPQPGATNFVFPRYSKIPMPDSKASRTLTPGTVVNTGSRSVTQTNKPVEILELGLGADATNTPIGVSSFVTAYSMAELENIILSQLGYDYRATVDYFLRQEIFRANTTYYNNSGFTTSVVGDLAANSDGTMSETFLINVNAKLKMSKIPTWQDGCYVLVTTPLGVSQLMVERSAKERIIDQAQQDAVSQLLQMNNSGYGDGVSGYKGKIAGFHVFEQNSFSVGADGTEGSRNETINSTATLTRSSYVLGADTIGWAEAKPVEIRLDDFTDFNRQKRMIWYAHGNSVSLDVAAGASENGWVAELRTIDQAI